LGKFELRIFRRFTADLFAIVTTLVKDPSNLCKTVEHTYLTNLALSFDNGTLIPENIRLMS
jgi:hypothetical protein